jgi:hypothetical protein
MRTELLARNHSVSSKSGGGQPMRGSGSPKSADTLRRARTSCLELKQNEQNGLYKTKTSRAPWRPSKSWIRRENRGTDVTKVMEASKRTVLEVEDEGHETQGQRLRGNEEATRKGPPWSEQEQKCAGPTDHHERHI